MKKAVFLFVFIIIAIILVACNAVGFLDAAFTAPVIWFFISVCNISSMIDFYASKRKGLGISYTMFSLLSIAFLVMSSMELAGKFQ